MPLEPIGEEDLDLSKFKAGEKPATREQRPSPEVSSVPEKPVIEAREKVAAAISQIPDKASKAAVPSISDGGAIDAQSQVQKLVQIADEVGPDKAVKAEMSIDDPNFASNLDNFQAEASKPERRQSYIDKGNLDPEM